jgi:hypothetical protein
VREAGATPGLQRLRLSSIEVNHVNDELVRALRETPTVSRHLHVPLQSGDDRVLSAMGRRYTAATYLRRMEPLADFNLTADVIVGFPAEDVQAFERTRRVLAGAGISKVHVFPYSPRPGTATAAEDDSGGSESAAVHCAPTHVPHAAVALARWQDEVRSTDPAVGTATTAVARRRLALGACARGRGCRGSSVRLTALPCLRRRPRNRLRRSRHQPASRDAPLSPERHVVPRRASSRPTRRSGCSSS